MKLRFLGLLSLALCVCLTSMVDAQPPQRGQRGQRGEGGGQAGGRGGPGGARGGFGGFQQGAAREFVALLGDEKVRKEVDVDDATYAKMDEESRIDFGALRDASEEERTKALKEANDKAQDMLDEVVSPDNFKRLMGLFVQQRGYSAATNDLIAKEVGVSDDDKKKVQEAADEARSSLRDKMREAFQGGGGGGADVGKIMEEMRTETDKAVAKALSSDQKKKLDALKGAKFEFSPPQFGGFGGRGGPGGGGGRPGGGGGRPAGGDRPGN